MTGIDSVLRKQSDSSRVRNYALEELSQIFMQRLRRERLIDG
jgi:hypothetical protein